MIALSVQNVTKSFRLSDQAAVRNISFELETGEILAIVGPSGCGKTTTLRLIAGLERFDEGRIYINGSLVASDTVFIPPEKRRVSMVFQDHALFPHMSVYDNVAFGLRGQKPNAIRSTVNEMLSLVGLDKLASRFPHALSGGERQRVALARALAPQPALILMDEPFSSLDADMRLEVREQVRAILKEMRTTVVFVTHDQEEALYMGDRLAVFHRGNLEQIGAPEEIFHVSSTRFVAEFMGDTDFLAGVVSMDGIETEAGLLKQGVALPAPARVEVAVRADDISFELDETGNGAIAGRFFRGAFNLYRLRLDSGQVLHALKAHHEILPVGARVQVHISPGHDLSIFHDGVAVDVRG